jgi:hypothetical protein
LSVIGALYGILTGISAEIAQAAPGRIVVENPTNRDERFCESFSSDERYRVCEMYINQFRREVDALATTAGLAKIEAALGLMFGGRVTKRALTEYSSRISQARNKGELRVETRAGAARIAPVAGAATGSSIAVPKNTFFGE